MLRKLAAFRFECKNRIRCSFFLPTNSIREAMTLTHRNWQSLSELRSKQKIKHAEKKSANKMMV